MKQLEEGQENQDDGDGEKEEEDGVLVDSKAETNEEPKSPSNGKFEIFPHRFFKILFAYACLLATLIIGGKRKRSEFDSDSGSDWEREGKEQAPRSPDGKQTEGEGSPTEVLEHDEKNQPKENDDVKTIDEDEAKEEEQKENGGPAQPRELHRTASIFLRNLAPTITKLEVEAVFIPANFRTRSVTEIFFDDLQMCKRYPGFLRAAIADPQPERRWFRRGWVTFERNVNIKEICWNLNNIRVSLISIRCTVINY